MIADRIENHRIYAPLGARIAAGLEYLSGLRPEEFREQTVELDGRNVYAMFQSYTTESEEGRYYEAHRAYVDIQFILEGTETIRVTNVGAVQVHSPYDADRDVAFYELAPGIDVVLGPGDFTILYPHDAHLPKLPAAEPSVAKKAVVKVLL